MYQHFTVLIHTLYEEYINNASVSCKPAGSISCEFLPICPTKYKTKVFLDLKNRNKNKSHN